MSVSGFPSNLMLLIASAITHLMLGAPDVF